MGYTSPTTSPVAEPRSAGRRTEWRSRIVGALPTVVLLVLVGVIAVQQPSFVGINSVRSLLESAAPILLLAIGQTFVILTGGIDLSFAAMASFGSLLMAMWIPGLGPIGVLCVLITTTLLGLINGLIIAYTQIPSFIATLGALGVYSGVGLSLSNGNNIRISDGYESIGWITDLRVAQLPLSAVLAVAIAVLAALAMRFLSRGRAFHALGLAEPAVLMSGNSTKAIRVAAFTLCGLFAGLAALVLAASLRSGGPTLADQLQLPAIAAVVIGGTAITGGVGGPMRTVVGALVIVVLRVGLGAIGIDPSFEQIVYGAVIVVAVVLTIDRTRLAIVK